MNWKKEFFKSSAEKLRKLSFANALQLGSLRSKVVPADIPLWLHP